MKILVGVAWPYANSYLHLGHIAGAYLPASIFARYHRLKGDEVLMVSGSDEHGTPTKVTAEKEGKKPEEIAKFYHKENSKVMEDLAIGFDLFTETSTENHKEVVQDFVLKLVENGYTYENYMDEPYCTNEKRFLPDRYVEGTCPYCGYKNARGDQCDHCGKLLDPKDLIDMRCKICGSKPEIRKSKHLFFKLSSFQDKLLEYSENKKMKQNVYNFTMNWIKQGLKDRAITRDISWGIEVPLEGYEEKRVYVWFEAVIGYLSATIEWAKKNNEPWESFWKDERTKHYYFVGKDNIPFHTIFWPAMLMAYGGLNLPDNVPANEYLLLDGAKLSKSRGISINAKDFLAKYDPDVLRYYLSTNMPEERDSEFRFDDFIEKNNNELVANLGNFVNRVLSFSYNNFKKIPDGTLEDRVEKGIEKAFKDVSEDLENCNFKAGIRRTMSLSQFGNEYFYEKEPWRQIKGDLNACKNSLYNSAQLVNALAILMDPYLPFTSEKIRKMLDLEKVKSWNFDKDELAQAKQKQMRKPELLFKKIEIGVFSLNGIELKIGKIEEVEDHPRADKLYVMKIDLGGEHRQIIAGLKNYLRREDLLNKEIVVVTNLRHAKLRGLESQGMLLAAEKDEKVVIIYQETFKMPGTRVGIGYGKLKKKVEIEDLEKENLYIEGGKARVVKGFLVTEDGTPIIAEIEDGAKIK